MLQGIAYGCQLVAEHRRQLHYHPNQPSCGVTTVNGPGGLPAAYFLAARFDDDFESAVLHAVNSGGQDQARAILIGPLVGVQTGLSNIPQCFLDALENSTHLSL